MNFQLRWTAEATKTFQQLQKAAERATSARAKASKQKVGKTKSSKQEDLFKQVAKAIGQLAVDPRHPSLHTHEYDSLEHPFDPMGRSSRRMPRTKLQAPTVSSGATGRGRAR